jgi:hypothetical protein
VSAFVCAGGGFLLAVLWFDLMFDVQAIGRGGEQLPEDVLAPIAAYYARVTTAAGAMSKLVAVAMAGTLAAIGAQIAGGQQEAWLPWVSLALALGAILLAGSRTVPQAVRLGTRADPPARQSALARSILREHLACAGAIALLLVLQLAFG